MKEIQPDMEKIETNVDTIQRNVEIITPILEKFQPNVEKSQRNVTRPNVESFDTQNVKIKYNKMKKRVSTQSKYVNFTLSL